MKAGHEEENVDGTSAAHRAVISMNGSFFHRAVHFSAKRGIAIACRLSVTVVDCDHIGWKSSKLILTVI